MMFSLIKIAQRTSTFLDCKKSENHRNCVVKPPKSWNCKNRLTRIMLSITKTGKCLFQEYFPWSTLYISYYRANCVFASLLSASAVFLPVFAFFFRFYHAVFCSFTSGFRRFSQSKGPLKNWTFLIEEFGGKLLYSIWSFCQNALQKNKMDCCISVHFNSYTVNHLFIKILAIKFN